MLCVQEGAYSWMLEKGQCEQPAVTLLVGRRGLVALRWEGAAWTVVALWPLAVATLWPLAVATLWPLALPARYPRRVCRRHRGTATAGLRPDNSVEVA